MRSEPNLPVSRLINASAAHGQPVLRLKPLAQAIALLMLAGTAQAAQPLAFSSGWFGAMGGGQNGGAHGSVSGGCRSVRRRPWRNSSGSTVSCNAR
ncbi:hypothetical protein TRE132_29290 [Pseudomonas chlororaphis subsp. aurantiaca]|nr:hypothetical protein TRE132_29290 [Pseudomonas chlororaphis subsp. aurantiaca]